jgi:exopolysaccharide biosynthesis polyprenyl glycosylphosphotransferase
MLAVGDLLAGLFASAAIGVIDGRVQPSVWAAIVAPVWILIAKLLGLYDRDQRSLRHLTVDEIPTLFTWSLAGTALVAGLVALFPSGSLHAGDVLRLGLTAAAAALLLRTTARLLWRYVTPPENALLVGGGKATAAVERKIDLFPDIHIVVAARRERITREDLQGPDAGLWAADRLLISSSSIEEQLIPELVAFCRRARLKLTVIPEARGWFGAGVALSHVADLPLLEYNTWDVSRSTQLLKRLIDMLAGVIGLVLLSPVFLLTALLVAVDSGRPVVFTQARAGQAGRPFRMLKFRTMVPNAEDLLADLVSLDDLDEPVFKLRDDPRVTWIGRLLRRTSLDELPQLVNVLLGQMSLVGPRPEQLELVSRYAPEHLFRLAVKPGMTGPMQVYGRAQLSFEERLSVERDYVENLSVARDLRILALTISSLLHGRGAF